MGGEDIRSLHWSEIMAKQVAETRKPPFVVAAGITPSGPVHPGTLCEFLFAHAVSRQLKKYGETRYVFISDDFDDLDAVPEPLRQYGKVIEEDMGMPLSIARDPAGCHKSFAEHFIAETEDIIKTFGVELEFIRASGLYRAGKYDRYAKMLCERKDEVKEIVRLSSNRETMPADWFPIVPLCEKCKNLARNTVLEYKDGRYRYKCSKCGHIGEDAIENHRYKLLFRLDWPTRQKFLGVAVEGGSVDHHSPGGTISTLVAIHRQVYNEEPPYMYKFGLLKYLGKKYSKSKGIGHTVTELLSMLPPEIIKYMLFKPDVDEDKELAVNSDTLFNILDDFRHASSISKNDQKIARADYKKAISFELCDAKQIWKADIGDMIIYYNIYGDWNKVAELVDDREGVGYLRPYMETWFKKGLVPERYLFEVKIAGQPTEAVREFINTLDDGMDAKEVHDAVFAEAARLGMQPQQLFKECYRWLIGKDMGPRLGKLIHAIGVKKLKGIAAVKQ